MIFSVKALIFFYTAIILSVRSSTLTCYKCTGEIANGLVQADGKCFTKPDGHLVNSEVETCDLGEGCLAIVSTNMKEGKIKVLTVDRSCGFEDPPAYSQDCAQHGTADDDGSVEYTCACNNDLCIYQVPNIKQAIYYNPDEEKKKKTHKKKKLDSEFRSDEMNITDAGAPEASTEKSSGHCGYAVIVVVLSCSLSIVL